MAAIFLAGASPAPPTIAPTADKAHQADAQPPATKDRPPEPFWEQTRDDPVAAFTLVLAAFTGVLTVATLMMWQEAKASGERRDRAYVFPSSCGMWDPGAPNGPPPIPALALVDAPNLPAPAGQPIFRPRSRIVVKNTGVTPAYGIRHWSRLVLCAVDGHGAHVPPKDISHLVPTSIEPGGTLSVERNYEGTLTQGEVQVLAQDPSTMMLMAYGKITYRDAFKRDRVTTYRVAWAGTYPPPHTVELVNVAGGDTAT